MNRHGMEITFLNIILVMIISLNILIILLSLLQKYKNLNLESPIEMMQKIVFALSLAWTLALPQSQPESIVLEDVGAGGSLAPTGCCDWPSCYDQRTDLCLDTCLMTWSPCPKRLFLMSCYSEFMSPFGPLPLQCFPDVANHIDQAESLGLEGSTKLIRDKLHETLNRRNCHSRTGICRPNQ